MFFPRLLTLVLLLICFATCASAATSLPPGEVEALQQIANTLGKTDWNFSVDPCSGQAGWNISNPTDGYENNVTCNCSIPNSNFCHVERISLKRQNLNGTLPKELVGLPYLKDIDLTFNYLNGTIPSEWGSLPLEHISLLGNRLTGSIPEEFGNITTLRELTLQYNQLSGAIPPALGNLTHIDYIHLSSNFFTGELPETLAKLTTLREFRISDNNFTGTISNFIQNWTNLTRLEIQASGLQGPIPSGIELLENMIDLRISDLNGNEDQVTFPQLSKMTELKTLILRSCNIAGELPDYLGSQGLTTLDLSFNKFRGGIPDSWNKSRIQYIFLTGNLLNGTVPPWLLDKGDPLKEFDLSYNNFTYESSRTGRLNCKNSRVNLFRSFSESNIDFDPCLENSQCQQHWNSFYINCGGSKFVDDADGNTTYDADNSVASMFYKSETNWALSSTGVFMLETLEKETYIAKNTYTLPINKSELYMDARLSPLSMTYYGFCLLDGKYTVNLHFAEIMFTHDQTYKNLGRRIFDVYIQGNLEWKDFNIVDKAGGVGKEIKIKFTEVMVTNKTLEIRFHWAGKGTAGIPDEGVYGPLISAIAVDPEFTPASENGNRLSAGTVVGIVVAIAFVIFLVLGILSWKGCLRCKDTMEQDLKGLDLQTDSFTLRQIKAATNNFDVSNKIGEGGFGPVYKGLLSDGTIIAVKQLSSKSKQGNREFVNEIGMISALQHPHLVKLYGCCIEGNQLLLVYEYMENNSLARALFGPEECQLELDWPTRHKICVGIARGLAYLHEESRLKIVHRDIKATNVLLDKNLNPKISDFGLAKLDEEEDTHISTRIAGTYGYMAPEYAMWGYLTDKADVYSFGVVALEIVSGRSATSYKPKGDHINLLDWALALKENGNLMELVDPRLGSDFNKEEVMVTIDVSLLCTNATAAVRPTMSSVVSMLEGRSAVVQELISDPSVTRDEIELKDMKNQYQYNPETDTSDSQIQRMLTDRPWTASSSSATDLYPFTSYSENMEKRD
uniref:non-specific serine/threonine protein kinase n=1 Tax=Davidia involucrata TaxID=16924 RepID=A0A5B7BQE0_DAVIN